MPLKVRWEPDSGRLSTIWTHLTKNRSPLVISFGSHRAMMVGGGTPVNSDPPVLLLVLFFALPEGGSYFKNMKQGTPGALTSSASQEANFRLLDLARLNELCLRSNFD